MLQYFAKCEHTGSCIHTWAKKEEIANIISHGIGFFLAIAALILLIVTSSTYGSALSTVCSTIFGASLVIAYAASSFYHTAKLVAPKNFIKAMDHIAIYILIAGTYTPFMLVSLGGAWGWSLFGVVWGLTIFGTVFKLLFVNRHEMISTILYLMMGWLALIAIVPIVHTLPTPCIIWILAGGIFYTLGVIFFLMETVPFAHTVWHLFVIAGSVCHFFAVLWYVAPIAAIA